MQTGLARGSIVEQIATMFAAEHGSRGIFDRTARGTVHRQRFALWVG
ncbi:MAG TPA: hypothetical protein VFR36_10245 [Sphingomicrobium sp.]|nr:hypothetical protein [Sphingomicrobium sp.]